MIKHDFKLPRYKTNEKKVFCRFKKFGNIEEFIKYKNINI
jgi:hypothetical protein